MLRPMVEPVRPPDPPPDPPSDELRPPDSRPDPLLDAPPDPHAIEAPPTDPARAYELPTARKVVSSGLQLAMASTSELRRASIYIGLLVLGAFGPTIIALLLIVGRLGDTAGEMFEALLLNEAFAPPTQAALEAALLVVAIEGLIGLALFLAISIDAQVMAISILGGRASERPLRLWESITRARQTFWRMAGAGALVGVVAGFVQLLLLGALGGLSQSAETASILASLLATIVVAPLAYVATSIVLGDVGAMEALSRSWRLFRVRRGLAVVVVLFTFVTSAIQLFALSGGLDLVIRAAELLQVSLTEGALAFGTATILILAAVVAYGSLTFTIGAIVSAPQVAGFLGLTFYSAGLDKARRDTPKPPAGFRYVSRPMLVAMVALTGIVALQVPAINAIPALPNSGIVEQLRELAAVEGDEVVVRGYPELVEDPVGDRTGAGPSELDLVRGEGAYLQIVPSWVIDRFPCDAPNVACGADAGLDGFEFGGYVFLGRTTGPLASSENASVGFLVTMPDEVVAPRGSGDERYGGASRAFVVRPGAESLEASRADGEQFAVRETAARARWDGSDVVLLIPVGELAGSPFAWDVVTQVEDDGGTVASGDSLRVDGNGGLVEWSYGNILILDFRETPGP